LPKGRFDLWRQRCSRSSRVCFGGRRRSLFSHAVAGKFDAVGIVDEAVEDGIGNGRIADHVVPVIDGNLAGDDRRSLLVSILDDFQEIAALLVGELLRPPVVLCGRPFMASFFDV
jgi:hypothetical protein